MRHVPRNCASDEASMLSPCSVLLCKRVAVRCPRARGGRCPRGSYQGRELAVSDNDFMWLVAGVCVAVARAADAWTLPEGDGGAIPRVDEATSALVASLFPDNLAQDDLLAEVRCISSWLGVMSPSGGRADARPSRLRRPSMCARGSKRCLGCRLRGGLSSGHVQGARAGGNRPSPRR